MYEDYFTFRSLTTAERGMQVLQRSRIPAQLTRTPSALQEQGCGFCIRVQAPSENAANWQLQHNHAPYSRHFRLYDNGSWEEIS